jgi:hypothetical protein
MKFCPVVPEICHGQVHGPRKERKKEENNNKSYLVYGRFITTTFVIDI